MAITNELSETTAGARERRSFRMLLSGGWVEARNGKRFETSNPDTGKARASVPKARQSEVDTITATTRTAVAAPCGMSWTEHFSS